MLLTLNAFLLSTFATHIKFGTDTKSHLKRYQILSLIYTNLTFFLISVGYEIIVVFFLHMPHFGVYTITNTPFLIISFFFLRRGNNQLAANIILIQVHTINILTGTYCRTPLVALYFLMLHPNITSMLCLSTRMRIVNFILTVFEGALYITEIRSVFQISLTTAQSFQISTLFVSAVICLIFACIGVMLQKYSENRLIKMAYADFEKITQLAKDLEQTSQSGDQYIKSLSQQIRNPLAFISGRIDYLLEVIRELQHIHVLKEVKQKALSVVNEINTMLDGVDLRYSAIELKNDETNLPEVLKNVFSLNLEELKRDDKFIQALIAENIPEKLWVDQSRLFQILMKLVSNGLEFSNRGNCLKFYAVYCPQNQDQQSLLSPIREMGLESENINRKRSAEIVSSLHNHGNAGLQKNDSSVFNEFTFEEAQNRRKNFQFIRSFRTRDTMGLNNSAHLEEYPEFWRIEKTTLHVPRDRQQMPLTVTSRRRHDARNIGFLKVQVSDSGCGISPTDLNNLFEPHPPTHNSQAPHTNTKKVKGLWICKQLCQKMGGDLKVYSELNKGTTFVFYLPISSNPRIHSLPNPQRPIRNTINALVVDDYTMNRDLHKLFLEKEGVKVTLACDGKEALDIYMEQGDDAFDFIMMDIQMPVMDGFSAAERIREHEEEGHQKKVDIYFVSGEYYHEEDVITRFKGKSNERDEGRIVCLKKPVNAEMIRSIVNRYKNRIRRGQTLQNIS